MAVTVRGQQHILQTTAAVDKLANRLAARNRKQSIMAAACRIDAVSKQCVAAEVIQTLLCCNMLSLAGANTRQSSIDRVATARALFAGQPNHLDNTVARPERVTQCL